MKAKLLTTWAMAAACFLVGATGAISSEKEKKTADRSQEAMMEAWQKSMTPNEHHAHMKELAGKWHAKVKHWPIPGAEPELAEASSENIMILGDRFLATDMHGVMMGMPFEGRGLSGFDNLKNKHFSVWVDNMGTAVMVSEGTCTEGGKVATECATMMDPTTGKDMKIKMVTRVINKDKHMFEMYMNGPDGKEFKSMEVTYERI